MSLSSSDLDRLADEQYSQRRISNSTYCDNCGYNLRSLPYAYTCPECGNEYNARPLKMIGIFEPYMVEFPFGDIVATVLCGAIGGSMIYGSASQLQSPRLLFGIAIAVMSLVFSVKSFRRMLRYLKARSITRRIEAEDFEE